MCYSYIHVQTVHPLFSEIHSFVSNQLNNSSLLFSSFSPTSSIGEAAVKQAQLSAEAHKIKSHSELEQLKRKQEAEITHQQALNDLEINLSRELAEIEGLKFSSIVDAIGANTIKSMAEAGPAMQAKLLQGLGLKSFLITDGNSPINLFNTASGLIGGPQ